MNKKFIFLTVISSGVVTSLYAETITNSMKTRRLFITSPYEQVANVKASVLSVGAFGYYSRIHFCTPDVKKKFQGIIFDYLYQYKKKIRIEITEAFAAEKDRVVGTHTNYVRKGLDDLIAYLEYNPSPATPSQAIIYGCVGVPIWRGISHSDLITTPLVGTRFFSLGAGVEYSYLYTIKDMGLGVAVNARLLHYCSRYYGKCLPGTLIHPGDQTDIVGEFHFQKKKHSLVCAYIYTNRWHINFATPALTRLVPLIQFQTIAAGYSYITDKGSFFSGLSYTTGRCRYNAGWIFGLALSF